MEQSALVAINGESGVTQCFRGTEVPFQKLIDYLSDGSSIHQFLRHFPSVPREMATQAPYEATESLISRIERNKP